MPHSIHVGFPGVTDFAVRIITALTQKDIISANNIYIPNIGAAYAAISQEIGLHVLPDDAAVLMKSEIAVITAPKREFGTALAPICALTRGKIIIAMTDGIDCDYVLERVTHGTLVAAAMPCVNEDGTTTAHIAFSAGFPAYMKGACRDIIEAVQA